MSKDKFRMVECLLLSAALFVISLIVAHQAPSSLLAVSLYKAHLMSLAGWGGYWIDRWAFPYARPHALLGAATKAIPTAPSDDTDAHDLADYLFHSPSICMIRRALIMLGCLICVGLGA